MRDRDYDDAIEFLSRFFEHTEHAVEIRALPLVSGSGPVRTLFTRAPDEVAVHCQRWDGPGRATYFGTATRRGGSGKGDRPNLMELVAVWVDIDCYKLGISKDDAVRALLALPIPAGIIIDSGGGIHGYWLLLEPIDISQDAPDWPHTEYRVVSVLRQLAGVLAGDIAVCDLARIMRLPGTHNAKDGTLRPCIVLSCSTWARVAFSDLEDMLAVQRPLLMAPAGTAAPVVDDDPFLAAARALVFKPAVDIEARLAAMVHLGIGEAAIHATQLSVTASLAVAGVDDDTIAGVVLAATERAAGTLAPSWNWRREEASIRAMIASARIKFAPETRPASRASATIITLRAGGPKPAPSAEEESDILPPLGQYVHNDIGNSLQLIDQHRTNLRYVLGNGWHVWDGKRYAPDPESILAQRMAHDVSVRMLNDAAQLPASKSRTTSIKWAIISGNKSRIGGMLDQARSYIHISADALDADPMLLNCANGTLDLAALALRPHETADLLTKLCPIDYESEALCPIWERFLLEIFDGDREVIGFVQRSLGYSLTGCTSEQVVFILHGAGSNGKSVLLETIAAVLADYVKRSPAETWISKPYSGPSNDIAALAGARFVSVIETEHDKALAEALVKQATGGDAMTVRFLHREFFSFVPKFKLWFATNHKPKIRGSDHAIWRRILLLPFLVTFVDADKLMDGQKVKDPDLKNKLVDEYPGILAWMVRGCTAWRESGLNPPDAVRLATESYQDAQDNVSGFIRDNCHISRGISCPIGLLYAGYENWCEANDETALAKRVFGWNLDERGFPSGPRSGRARLRQGIDLKYEFKSDAEKRQAVAASGV